MACSLFDDLRRQRITISGLPLYKLNLAGNGDWAISQRPQELFSADVGNVLHGHKTSKDLLWVVAAKVQKGVALLRNAYLLNQPPHTNGLSDVNLCLSGKIGAAWQ